MEILLRGYNVDHLVEFVFLISLDGGTYVTSEVDGRSVCSTYTMRLGE